MLAPAASPPPIVAPPCTQAQRAGALQPIAVGGSSTYRLTCSLVLSPGDKVVRTLRLEGAEASGVRIDCQGGALGEPGGPERVRVDIASRREGGGWSRPADIRVERCTLYGAARIWGMGGGDRDEELRLSSRRPDHTAQAQAAAPTRIVFDHVVFATRDLIPLYVGPGTTRVSVLGSRFEGRAPLAVYLDAETADNVLQDNSFDLATRREVVAVDGSARNRIVGNRFTLQGQGGIFLYRNCGERGVIRHQPPVDNQITGNRFRIGKAGARTVVVGSRQGRGAYCGDDAGYPFGSSADDGDHAERNILADNVTLP